MPPLPSPVSPSVLDISSRFFRSPPAGGDAFPASVALFSRATTLFAGVLTELSGIGAKSVAVAVARQFLRRYESPLPWVLSRAAVPYAPDLEESGIDLNRVIWISPDNAADMRYTIDTLLGSALFPAVCVELRNFTALTPGIIARFMHRARHTGTAVFFVLPRFVPTPSPAIGYHFEVGGDTPFQRDIIVHRCRNPIWNDECHVSAPSFLL